MDVLSAIDSLSERKERLRTALSALECKQNAMILSNFGANWNDVEVYLNEVEKRLRVSLLDIVSKETSIKEREREAKEVLAERETGISRREQASLSLVQEKKDAAVASILEAKRKWNNEQLRDEEGEEEEEKGKKKGKRENEKQKQNEKVNEKPNQKEKEIENGKQKQKEEEKKKKKETERERENLMQKQNEKKEMDDKSCINTKPLKVNEGVEEKRDEKKETLKAGEVEYDDEKHVQRRRREEETFAKKEALTAKSDNIKPQQNSIAGTQNHLSSDVDATSNAEKPAFNGKVLSLSGLLTKEANSTSVDEVLKPRPMLKSLCEAMDSEKLRLFIADRRKDLNGISAELPFALKSAPHPAVLVLKALEGYHPPEGQSSVSVLKKEASSLLLANKRACVILLESLADVMKDRDELSEELKKSAQRIADSWKSKINLQVDLTSNQAIEAQSLLQLLATFGLASEYDPDELCKLVIPITRRRQTPSLCRTLGLSSKVPDIIERLIKDGKQIEAIAFATEFDLLERFPPVPLLKTYLKDSRKVVQNTPKGQNDANHKELSALKVVLKAINDLKLEEKYPSAPLEKRIAQLEKAKADKKRTAGTARPQQMKRPRTNVNFGSTSRDMVHDKPFYQGRVAYGESVLPYNAATTHSGYDRHLLNGYSSTYAGGAPRRSPVSMQSSYIYPSDAIASLGYGSSAYASTNAPYSSYAYGSGLPSGYQSYH